MRIYIVLCGEYSESIAGAFSSREGAVAFIEFKLKFCQYPDTYAIYEMAVDEPKVTSNNNMFLVSLVNGVWVAQESDYVEDEEFERLRLLPFSLENMSGVFFAEDKDHAIKMAQDAYAKTKAEEIGL